MILWTGKPHTVETAPAWEGAPLRAWRWVLKSERWAIEAEEQVKRGNGEWCAANRYLGFYLSRRPRFGFRHIYHDGPHHSLWLGFVNVSWMRCKRCAVCEGEP